MSLSSSISESNRMRAELGLAPLVDNAASAAASSSSAAAPSSTAADEHAQVEEIRAELARRKEKRRLESLLSTSSLGDALTSATSGSAKDWIERSRKLGLAEAEQAKKKMEEIKKQANTFSATDYSADELTGMKISHDYSEFSQGEEVILTLKDSRILSGVAHATTLNEEEDELTNQDLVEKENQKEINDRRKALKNKAAGVSNYNKSDDFYGGDEETELLSKYSEQKQKAGLRLGNSGALSASEIDLQTHSQLYAQDEARRAANQLVYSLGGEDTLLGGEKQRTFQADYKDIKFKKKKKNSSAVENGADATMDSTDSSAAASSSSSSSTFKKKSSSSASQRHTKAPTSSLLDLLPEPSESERLSELSSRHNPQQSASAIDQQLQQKQKDERYLKAIQAAELASQKRNELDAAQAKEAAATAATSSSTSAGSFVPPPPKMPPPKEAFKSNSAASSIPPPPPPPPPAINLFEEEDDSLLAESLARARRIALKKSKDHSDDPEEAKSSSTAAASSSSYSSTEPYDSVKALAERVKLEQQKVKTEPGLDSSSSSSSSSRLPPGMTVKSSSNDGIIFTATTEFVRGLQFGQKDDEHDDHNAKTKLQDESKVKKESSDHAMDIDHEEKGGEKKDRSEDANGESEEDGSDDDDDEDDNNLTYEEDCSSGIAGALKYFKSRGILTSQGSARTDLEGKINSVLDKYDPLGRELSKKEQFRFLSHKFHGVEAGLNLQEKRLNRLQVEAQKQQALRETGGMVDKVAEEARMHGTAHVVMDKKLEQKLATGHTTEQGGEENPKKRKHAGPFAKFGFGKGNFKHKKAKQEATKKQLQQPTHQ